MSVEAQNIDTEALRIIGERNVQEQEVDLAKTLDQFLQGGDVTPEPDPFAESDSTNIQAIQERIDASESNVLETRDWAEQEFDLIDARVAGIIKLDTRAFPDLSFAALADSGGEVYALVYNHNMNDCLREPFEQQDLLEETIIDPGPPSGFFAISIREVETTPVVEDARLGSITLERFIDRFPIILNGQEEFLPVLVIKGFESGGEEFDCPTIGERASDVLGSLVDRAQEAAEDFDLGNFIEGAADALGSAVGRFSTGFERGLDSSNP